MPYTVITYVPEADPPPMPGEEIPVPVYELGCVRCVVDYAKKLKVCWQHNKLRVLWARQIDGPPRESESEDAVA